MGKRSREEDAVSTVSSDDGPMSAASPAKIQETETAEGSSNSGGMQCLLPPHAPLSFSSTTDFDVHYVKEHTNRCSSCGKNFPSTHYLTLHIDENHNPLREALAAQGEKTFACFIEDCDRKCSTPQKRRLHLIDKHMFPKAYNFRITDQGIDRSNSLLLNGQRRRLSTSTQRTHQRRASLTTASSLSGNTSQSKDGIAPLPPKIQPAKISEKQDTSPDDQIDEIGKSLTALQFVPPSVRTRQHKKKNG